MIQESSSAQLGCSHTLISLFSLRANCFFERIEILTVLPCSTRAEPGTPPTYEVGVVVSPEEFGRKEG